jgi:hypothetical protein
MITDGHMFGCAPPNPFVMQEAQRPSGHKKKVVIFRVEHFEDIRAVLKLESHVVVVPVPMSCDSIFKLKDKWA